MFHAHRERPGSQQTRTHGHAVVVPQLRPGDEAMEPRPWIDDFSAGYMQRAMPRFPRQGDREPWVNSQDYKRERREFAHMDLDEAALRYSPASGADRAATAAA